MKLSRFCALCRSLGIEPSVALENEKILAALTASDDELVEMLLMEEF